MSNNDAHVIAPLFQICTTKKIRCWAFSVASLAWHDISLNPWWYKIGGVYLNRVDTRSTIWRPRYRLRSIRLLWSVWHSTTKMSSIAHVTDGTGAGGQRFWLDWPYDFWLLALCTYAIAPSRPNIPSLKSCNLSSRSTITRLVDPWVFSWLVCWFFFFFPSSQCRSNADRMIWLTRTHTWMQQTRKGPQFIVDTINDGKVESITTSY